MCLRPLKRALLGIKKGRAQAMRGEFWEFQNQQVHENLSINALNSMHVIFKFSPGSF